MEAHCARFGLVFDPEAASPRRGLASNGEGAADRPAGHRDALIQGPH
jgi:hypothetical protein